MLRDDIETAVLRNHPEAIISLADNIRNVNSVNYSGHHSLLFAAGCAGNVEAAQTLYALGVKLETI